jgi:hypothetical protein
MNTVLTSFDHYKVQGLTKGGLTWNHDTCSHIELWSNMQALDVDQH